ALTLPLLALAGPALAQDVAQATTAKAGGASVTSPDGSIRVTVTTDGDGRPYYSVTRNGKPLILPSRMGFMLGDAPKLE
ncbi:glycoside hydrolase family 97 N-terminal domain-containing protein, partial [Lacticaseibacillus paracasei]